MNDPPDSADRQTRFARREMIVFSAIFSSLLLAGFITLLIFLMRLPAGRS